MRSRRMPKSMIEKREVIDWIEANCPQAPSRAATYFKNTRGWVVSPAHVRYWWKQRDEIRQASPTQLRLCGGGAKPQRTRCSTSSFSDLSLFMKRYGLSLRRTTNLTVLSNEVLITRTLSYMIFLSSHRSTFDPMRTVLMDETAVYFEDPRVDTWLDMTFPCVFDANAGKAIVWDSMRAHIAKAVKARCNEKKIQAVVVPGGMTPYLQAGDIGIYKSFKDHISPIIDAWKSSDQVEYTSGGNPKPPAHETVARWVESAWKAVPQEVVEKSILGAGFSDNFEDCHISRHDVYSEQFRDAWLAREPQPSEIEQDPDLEDLADDFDELIVD
eukprot:jgi/Phyca11/20616/fgenesh1_pg.PHYCAscaffold_68_\